MAKVKMTGTIENAKWTGPGRVLLRKITTVTWADATGRKISKAKYGKEIFLHIDTEDCMGCSALVVVQCDDWKEDHISFHKIMRFDPFPTPKKNVFGNYTLQPRPDAPEKTKISFIPEAKWLKNSEMNTGCMSAKVYIVFSLRPYYYPHDYDLQLMAEEFKKNDTDYRSFSVKPFRDKYYTFAEMAPDDIPVSKIVIVLDPGHGVSAGNVGVQARNYKYKQQGDDGKEKKDNKGNVLTFISDVETIPQYVIDNSKDWVVGTIEQQTLDPNRTESFYVYDISQIINELLKNKGYYVIITRTSRNVVSGYTTKTAISFRNDIANNNKADYFISFHYDGANNFDTCGCHAIYNSANSDDKVFAETVLKYYTVVEKMTKHPDARTDLGVLGAGNEAKYKTLIEFGFISSLKDAKAMYLNKNLVAQQVVQGIEEHINKYFKL